MLKEVKAFTIVEILVVLLILGTLIALALPNFGTMKERTLDREAKANLKLIQAAEKIYHMEFGEYWTCSDETCINTNLKLSLPTSTSRNWQWSTQSGGDTSADRNETGGRTWTLLIGDEDPACSGSGCP